MGTRDGCLALNRHPTQVACQFLNVADGAGNLYCESLRIVKIFECKSKKDLISPSVIERVFWNRFKSPLDVQEIAGVVHFIAKVGRIGVYFATQRLTDCTQNYQELPAEY